ncbi:MAG: class I SAM-dependent methyltransferase [Eubacterium sp.]
MSNSIKDYRNLIEQPWGKMFYDMIFKQLNISKDNRLNILDFGAGFCVTANHYAKHHNVTAIEPSKDMYSLRIKENDYNLIVRGVDALTDIPDNTFDIVICHNVLEYVEDRELVLRELSRVLKPNGKLSIVKHNLYGRVLSYAVLNDEPKSALDLLNNNFDNAKNMFGKRDTYSNEYLVNLLADKMTLTDIFGIRTFFGLSANSEIKYSNEWYQSMLELEMKASEIDEYKKVAFFNHLIFCKGM